MWNLQTYYFKLDFQNVDQVVNPRHQTSNIRRAVVGNKIVDPSDVVGSSPVGAAPITS